jgi:hypothetical protein
MILVREVLQCKPGKVGELLKKFQALSAIMEPMGLGRFRLLTDLSGPPFWTLVAETESESVDTFLQGEQKIMAHPDARQAMSGYHELLLSGRREIYRIMG